MLNVTVLTSDSKVWNFAEVCTTIATARATKQDLVLDLNKEGPDFETLGLVELIGNYPTKVVTSINLVQRSINNIVFDINGITKPNHWITTTIESLESLAGVVVDKNIKHPLGLFIGRSNPLRLLLSSYVHSIGTAHQTFRYDSTQEFHNNNLGVDQLVEKYGLEHLDNIVKLLHNSPLVVNDDRYLGASGKLPKDHVKNTYRLHREYKHFLVELVCETYYTGRTFSPTEKTWRPIILETPFIVQGPQWYLHRLRDLGFQTFDRWWDEGYSEDPASHQPHEIFKVIDFLSKKSINELNAMYIEMQPTLQHNRTRLMELTCKDFEIFNNDKY
jgi:hypothetical protein